MKTKHTPGPWVINPINHCEILADGRLTMNTVVANVPVGMPDARLIAAAPEMLEALEKIKETLDIIKGGEFFAMNYELLLVNRAIAKAKGDL